MPKLSSDHRRALKAIVEGNNGCIDQVLQLLGFSERLIAELIRAGLVSAEVQRAAGEKRMVKVRRIRITNAGLQEIATPSDD